MTRQLIVTRKTDFDRDAFADSMLQVERWANDPTNQIPAGAVMGWMLTSAPPGWLIMNGTVQLYTSFPALYGYAVSAGWVTTTSTFTLPDFTGQFLRGGTPGVTGGSTTHTHVLSGANGQALIAMAAIVGTDNLYMNRVAVSASWNANLTNQTTMTFGGTGAPTGQTVGAALTGATNASSNPAGLPPFTQVNWIVKT